jgi:hypothetical protein
LELAQRCETLDAQLSSGVESAAQEANFESKHRISQVDEELRCLKEETELYMTSGATSLYMGNGLTGGMLLSGPVQLLVGLAAWSG